MVKILVAAPSEPVREMFKVALEKEGYEVLLCSGGKVALDKAKESDNMDLFLVDINMPDLDGVGLTKKIRTMSQHKLTPIIALTSESGEFIEKDGRSAGYTGWILKPLDQRKILAAVNDILYDE